MDSGTTCSQEFDTTCSQELDVSDPVENFSTGLHILTSHHVNRCNINIELAFKMLNVGESATSTLKTTENDMAAPVMKSFLRSTHPIFREHNYSIASALDPPELDSDLSNDFSVDDDESEQQTKNLSRTESAYNVPIPTATNTIVFPHVLWMKPSSQSTVVLEANVSKVRIDYNKKSLDKGKVYQPMMQALLSRRMNGKFLESSLCHEDLKYMAKSDTLLVNLGCRCDSLEFIGNQLLHREEDGVGLPSCSLYELLLHWEQNGAHAGMEINDEAVNHQTRNISGRAFAYNGPVNTATNTILPPNMPGTKPSSQSSIITETNVPRVRIDYSKKSISKVRVLDPIAQEKLSGRIKRNFSESSLHQIYVKPMARSNTPFISLGHRCDSPEFMGNKALCSKGDGAVLSIRSLYELHLHREQNLQKFGKKVNGAPTGTRAPSMIRYNYLKRSADMMLSMTGKDGACSCQCHSTINRKTLVRQLMSERVGL